MQLQQQVIAHNTKPNVVVLSSDAKGTEFVEWQPVNDPNGGDYQVLPESLINHHRMSALIQRGIIEIVEDGEAYQAAQGFQNASFEKRLNSAATNAAAVMDPEAKNDILSLPCVGPDGRGQGKCGTEVPVRESTKNEKPPLCSTHEALAPQYVSSEEQEGTQRIIKWTRVTMGAPERQQA